MGAGASIAIATALAVTSVGCGRVNFDTRTDAGADMVDAPPGTFCATLPAPVTFCSDLSAGRPEWDPYEEMIDATYTFVAGGGPPSTPASAALVVTTDGVPGPAEASVFWYHPTPATRVIYSFDARIDTVGSGFPVLGLITFNNGTIDHGIEYIFGGFLEEFAKPGVTPPLMTYTVPAFPAQEWHRVEVDTSLAAPATASVRIDQGVPTVISLYNTVSGPPLFSVGMPFLLDGSVPWVIRISNVVVDVQ